MKTGVTIEKISYVFDHVLRKSVLGFKNLTLAHFDGISYKVVDFFLHSEKKLSIKKRKKQYKSKVTTGSKARSRIKECNQDKISNGIKIIKRAAKNGFKFKYILTDSWFVCEKPIKEIRKIKNGEIHLFGAVRKDRRKYSFLNKELNANELLNELKAMNGCKGKRNRKNNYHYYEAICIYKGIPTRLFFAKGKHQRHWKLFLTTDTTANFNKFCEIYSIRWGIEATFLPTLSK